MIYGNRNDNENGYLLLESLTTLGVIASILLILFPLIIHWMVLRNDSKKEVEINRVFYESSFCWEQTQTDDELLYNKEFKIQSDEQSLAVVRDEQVIEVKINGYEFK